MEKIVIFLLKVIMLIDAPEVFWAAQKTAEQEKAQGKGFCAACTKRLDNAAV